MDQKIAAGNGTYIAFHVACRIPSSNADVKHYNLLKAWTLKKDNEFSMITSHEKVAAKQDAGLWAALQARLETNLQTSKHLLLVIENTDQADNEWISMEIGYAVDQCKLPIIAAYTKYDYVLAPKFLSALWPGALKSRIEANIAHVMHIPFKKKPIKTAMNQFNPSNRPKGPLAHYPEETYQKWGLIK